MKLAAIFNVWADVECIFPYALRNIEPVVDGVIIVYSFTSNHGNYVPWAPYALPENDKIRYYMHEPKGETVHHCEIGKRNFGLEKAKQLGFTHFIMLDGDEFYERSEFEIEKEDIKKRDVEGMVCRTKVYFKSPSLTIGYDNTIVPFIHKITPRLRYFLGNKTYPFSQDANGHQRIDPTRKLNITSGVEWSNITMHHFSYVRRDMSLKIQNSSANLRRSADVIKQELLFAEPGYKSQLYHKEIFQCENIFNIPEL